MLLAHQTDWNKRSTSDNAQNSFCRRLGIFKISGKIGVLKHSQSALLRTVSHMTILPEFTREVDVRNQTSQASATSSKPFRDCSCQFVNRPQNIRSADARQYKGISTRLESKRLTILPRFPVPLTWTIDRRCKVWRLHSTARCFCFPIRSNVQGISVRVPPCRWTTL